MSSVHHKIILKRKTIEEENPLVCYCGLLEGKEEFMFKCEHCGKKVHLGCLKSQRPSPLQGDIYFSFLCQSCGPNFEEKFERLNLPWTYVLLVTLFNLHIQGRSNCGYFKWRTQICAFVDKHWATFFGPGRKKSNTWPGTVAGTLSSNSPQLFKSGTTELKEAGWWALTNLSLPSLDTLSSANKRKYKTGKSKARHPVLKPTEITGLRLRSTKSSIQTAIELKEKRSNLKEAKEIRQSLTLSHIDRVIVKEEDYSKPSTSGESASYWDLPLLHNFKHENEIATEGSFNKLGVPGIKVEPVDVTCQEESISTDITGCPSPQAELVKQEPEKMLPNIEDSDSLNDIVDECVIGLNLDIETEKFHFLQSQSLEIEDLMAFNSSVLVSTQANPVAPMQVSQVPVVPNIQDYLESSCLASNENEAECDVTQNYKNKKEKTEVGDSEKPSYVIMTEYDEHQLLKRLEKLQEAVKENFAAKRLRRKLIVRQEQRERNIPLFDLDKQYKSLCGLNSKDSSEVYKSEQYPIQTLDRYQMVCHSAQGRSHNTFVTRLMGFDDEHLESIVSPYTMRTLKPFIFRDYESTPLKLKLLHEVQHYYERKDPYWEKPKRYSLDYCYVRPHHIPVINSLCQDFFWSGIDLSECLQYPDFSCVVLYRKVIVGFAFMVPDVKYNEVYISFIFTHPEWRNAGIATFMIYHLIQTCMGKDVTLHVSVTNPALFLYQKFGFKVEELALDFYDKYLPVRSKECRHALFLRLSR